MLDEAGIAHTTTTLTSGDYRWKWRHGIERELPCLLVRKRAGKVLFSHWFQIQTGFCSKGVIWDWMENDPIKTRGPVLFTFRWLVKDVEGGEVLESGTENGGLEERVHDLWLSVWTVLHHWGWGRLQWQRSGSGQESDPDTDQGQIIRHWLTSPWNHCLGVARCLSLFFTTNDHWPPQN